MRAAIGAPNSYKDDLGRTFAGEIKLAPGRYRINDVLDIAPTAGLAGLTISGTGAATEIIFDGRAATILCSSSRGITFRDLTLRSMQGVDADQTAFSIDQHGNPLRSWRFERCDFIAFYQCFAVTGSALCSEFYFDKCQFLQCYRLMSNHNEQAVNWNFTNCNWENGEIETRKEKGLSSIFFLTKGTFAYWVGGSMVFKGRIVLFNLTQTGSVQRPSHLIAFDGVRIELEGDEDPAPFVDRIDAGYASGTNQPTVAFTDCTILQRGSVPNPVYARAWANCSISFVNCKAKGGRVVGILDHVSPTQTASIRLENTHAIYYEEDIKDRLNTHDQHNVRIIADGGAASDQPIIDQRLCSLNVPATMHPKYMYVRSQTGSLPLGGTVVHLAPMPDHTMIMRLFVRRFQTSLHRLVVELRDGEDRTTYGTAILATGANRFAEGDIGAEIGFQISTGTSLMLKFTGVPEIIKGIVGIEYL
ncbi:MAG: hypothetical protein EOO77_07280 [Oxalobacteraceae bacterium]|nr:MAG: hypothetical protein EOO77_07280 [Oxalobacteraceae bacterium]